MWSKECYQTENSEDGVPIEYKDNCTDEKD